MEKERVIVVGSGFGGAVSACRLSQAGYEVVLLERGRRYTKDDFPSLPQSEALLPDFARWLWSADRGLWDIEDLGELISVQSAGYGGGSLIYANVHLRPPKDLFDERWPEAYRGDKLDEFFDLAGFMLDAEPLAEARPKIDALEQFARDEHRTFFRPPLTITQSKKRHLDRDRPACTRCARCSTGCPVGAKNTLDWNYLEIAEKHGATVFTQSEVRDLERTNGAWEVTYQDHILQQERRLSAPFVFLCAGALNSTRLLAKLHARTSSVPNVGLGYFPNADAVGMVYDTRDALDPSDGPTIGGSIVHWQASRADKPDAKRREFFLVQDGGYSHELDRVLGVFRADLWLNRNRYSRADPQAFAALSGMQRVLASVASVAKSAEALVSPLDALTQIAGGAWQRWRNGGIPLLAKPPVSYLTAGAEYMAGKGLQRLLGFAAGAGTRRWMLLAMGTDATPGRLHYDAQEGLLIADLDRYYLLPMYQRQESLLTEMARWAGGELRVNPAWSFMGKPYTVHGQGGCRMSEDAASGVTNPDGAVHGCEGLYVLDGSMMCSSVGVNPSATITAIAERCTLRFIRSRCKDWPEQPAVYPEGALEYASHRKQAHDWRERARAKDWDLTPPSRPPQELPRQAVGVEFDERMRGAVSKPTAQTEKLATILRGDARTGDDTAAREHFRALEASSGAQFLELRLQVRVPNLASFIEDCTHEAEVLGEVVGALPGRERTTYEIASGSMKLFIPRFKPYALEHDDEQAKSAFKAATGRDYSSTRYRHGGTPVEPDARARLMVYELWLREPTRSEEWLLTGVKRLRQDPGLDLWDDTSSLYITLSGPCTSRDPNARGPLQAAGLVHIGPLGFLDNQRKLRAIPEDLDLFHKAWAIATFHQFFYLSLHQVYARRAAGLVSSLFRLPGGPYGR